MEREKIKSIFKKSLTIFTEALKQYVSTEKITNLQDFLKFKGRTDLLGKIVKK